MGKWPEAKLPAHPQRDDDRAGESSAWQAFGLDPDLAAGRLAGATVTVEVYGDVPTPGLGASLSELGLRVGEVSDLTLALADHYLHEALWERNLAALASGQPWFLACPVGRRLQAGPAFWPGRTACWECLADLLREELDVGARGGDGSSNGDGGTLVLPPLGAPDPARLPCTVEMGLSMAVTEMARAMAAGEPPSGEVKVHRFDLVDRTTSSLVVLPRKACPACSAQGQRANLRSVPANAGRKRPAAGHGAGAAEPAPPSERGAATA